MIRLINFIGHHSRSSGSEDLGAARVGDEDEAQGEGGGEGGDEDELDGVFGPGGVDEVEGRDRPDQQEGGYEDGDSARGQRDGALVETADLGPAVAGWFCLWWGGGGFG